MSETENNLSSRDISMMHTETGTTRPFSYRKSWQSNWSGPCQAERARLRTERFVDFDVPYFPRKRFVCKKGSEHRPTSIQDRFRHACFCQRRRIDIAHDNQLVVLNQSRRQFVEKIFSPILDLCVYRTNALLFARPLNTSKRRLQVPVEPLRLNHFSVRRRHRVLQPQVNTNLSNPRRWFRIRDFARYVNVPPTTRVLTETTRLDGPLKRTRQPAPKNMPCVGDGISINSNSRCLKGDPAQGSFATPPQPSLAMLLASRDVLLTDCLYSLRVQSQQYACSRRQFAEVNARDPLFIPSDGMMLRLIGEVPYLIHGICHAIQVRARRAIFNAIGKRFHHWFFWSAMYCSTVACEI